MEKKALPAPERIKAVFLDIDGTLFSHSDWKIPDSAVQAVHRLQEKGIRVIACTGRHTLEMAEMPLDSVRFDALVTLNGALCLEKDEIIYHVPLQKEDLASLLEALQEDPFACIFLEKDCMYMNMHSEAAEKGQQDINTSLPPVTDVSRALENNVYMIVPYVQDDVWQKASAGMKHIKAARWSEALDVFHEDTGKAKGMQEVCRYFGWTKDEVIACGDGPNDLEMKEACGFLAAMGNSVDALMKAADYITDDIDEDGLAHVFEALGLL